MLAIVVGGLGIKDLEKFNVALLGKWRWRLYHDQDSTWNQVIRGKYCEDHSSKLMCIPSKASP